MGKEKGIVDKSQNYQIAYKTLEDAIAALSTFFGMSPSIGTEKVNVGSSLHQMSLAGEVFGKDIIMAIVKVKIDQKYGCVLSLQVRGMNQDFCQVVIDSVS